MGKSGADLEYERMLREAGISAANAAGYDAARLEQLRDEDGGIIAEAELPDRLKTSAKVVTNWNNATETGFYNSDGAATNAPGTGNSWAGVVVRTATGIIQKLEAATHPGGSPAGFERTYNIATSTWGAWYQTFWSALDLDARYKNVGELVANNELPGRLSASSFFINDANVADSNGWYYAFAAGSANFPYAGNWLMNVITAGTLWITQTAHEYSIDGSTDTVSYRRERNNNVWGSWYRIRQSEDELDARYKNVGEAVTDAELPARIRSAVYTVTDANLAVENGWYRITDTGINAPSASFWFIDVMTDGPDWLTQTAHQYGLANASDTKAWRRHRINSIWSSWYRLRLAETELDTRYVQSSLQVGGENLIRGTAFEYPNDTEGWVFTYGGRTATQIYTDGAVRPGCVEITSAAGDATLFSAPQIWALAGESYVISVYVKRQSGAGDPTGVNIFTATAGYMVTTPATTTYGSTQVTPVGNGWYRASIVVTVTASGNLMPGLRENSNTGNTWRVSGLQVERGTRLSGWKPKAMEDSGWIAPTLQNSWVNFGGGYASAAYRKIGNRVTIRGFVKSGTVAAGTNLFTLPAGYRPTEYIKFPATTYNVQCNLRVGSDGTVVIDSTANADSLSLNSISFLTD